MPFDEFMRKVTAKLVRRIIDAEYLQTVTDRVNDHFGTHHVALATFHDDPRCIDYAVTLMTEDGRWHA